jgi:hypothetical protein
MSEDHQRRGKTPRFMVAIREQAQSAALLATFLLLEHGLSLLVRLILSNPTDIVREIIDVIDIGSALTILVLFGVHFVSFMIEYVVYLSHQRSE